MNPNDADGLAQVHAPGAAGSSSAPTEAERALLLEMAQHARVPLIIERPEALLSARGLTNYALTFLWWSVWGHFMLPLATLVLWMSGYRRLSEELLNHGGLDVLLARLPLYGAVVGVLSGALVVWALLNWWRFAGPSRRRSFAPVSRTAIARSFRLPPDELARWQQARRLVVLHDSDGRPIGVQRQQIGSTRTAMPGRIA